MSGPSPEDLVVIAQARSAAARARLSTTIEALQRRASPKVLVHDLGDTLKGSGTGAVIGLVDRAKRKPVATGIAVALFGVFLARRRIVHAVRATRDNAKR